MAKKNEQDGCANVVGGALIGVVVLIAMIPKEIWIGLGIAVAAGLVWWLCYAALTAAEKSRDEAEKRERAARAAEAAAAKRRRDEAVRTAKQQLIEAIGEKNALLVQSARTSVQKVAATEAARTGWLGDVDFTADITAITETFRKAHALRKVAEELSALKSPSADDRKILKEAKNTVENLERAAVERVTLIGKCATEAKLIDESLSREREEARTAEQRAELHATLSGMLYGVEATPAAASEDSTAEAVMARVQAYREIKNQIRLVAMPAPELP